MLGQNDIQFMEQSDVIIRSEGLTKQFSGVVVVNKVDLTVKKGSIHAIVGENGAGKSTLVKMIAGDLKPDDGRLFLDSHPINLENPRHASLSGIAMVHQEMQLVPTLDVISNLMLVNPPDAYNIRRGTKAELNYVNSQLARVGLDINSKTLVSSLSVAQAQLLEIAKALCLNAKVIIFDEPTSALPPKEVEALLKLIISLRDMGHAIIYISHHLSEVLYLADSITVMRDANVVGNFDRGEATENDLIRLMVDRPVGLYSSSKPNHMPDIVLSANKISTARASNITLELHKGEILGFAGLLGSGMQEAARALSGAVPIRSGLLRVNGRQMTFRSPYQALQAGIAYVPEDRKIDGIIPDATLDDNFHVGRFHQFSKRGFLDRKKMKQTSLDLAKEYGVHYKSIFQPIKSLSGGNQQKVVVARCVQTNPQVLILSDPTRGIDVAAKDDIHQQILSLASRGTSIILISSELEEVIALSNRVAVFCSGQLVSILEQDQVSPTTIMSLATPKRNGSNGEKHNEIN